jgi:hypothetical protein
MARYRIVPSKKSKNELSSEEWKKDEVATGLKKFLDALWLEEDEAVASWYGLRGRLL